MTRTYILGMNGEEGRPYIPIGGPLNICHTCPVLHYDNCEACFGFGVQARKLDGHYVPIGAAEAIEGPTPEWRPCPTCHSTPRGLPEGVTESDEPASL